MIRIDRQVTRKSLIEPPPRDVKQFSGVLDTGGEYRRVDHRSVGLREEHCLALQAAPASELELRVDRAEKPVDPAKLEPRLLT